MRRTEIRCLVRASPDRQKTLAIALELVGAWRQARSHRVLIICRDRALRAWMAYLSRFPVRATVSAPAGERLRYLYWNGGFDTYVALQPVKVKDGPRIVASMRGEVWDVVVADTDSLVDMDREMLGAALRLMA